MSFPQLVALMQANTGHIRLFATFVCRPFAMDECFSSSGGAKLRVNGRDFFPSPSLRATPAAVCHRREAMDGIFSRPLR